MPLCIVAEVPMRFARKMTFRTTGAHGTHESPSADRLFIEPGSPWENGYIESFNARFRYEFLDAELFYTVREAQVLAEMWRQHYNRVRPHSSLGGRPPAPEAFLPLGWTKDRTSYATEAAIGLTH